MRNLAELGIENNSSVTDEMVESIQRSIGFSLPQDYIEFVKFNDEAEPEIGGIRFGSQETLIDSFFKFTDNEHEEYGILNYNQLPGFPEHLVPIARDPGDALFCISFKDGGAIVFYSGEDQDLIHVSDSFGEFINSLIDL